MIKLVIANRGEIARRILRAARTRGYCVAVISTQSDFDAVVRREADAVLEVPSFLDAKAIVQVALDWGAHFVHPGYGFLSENAAFAEMIEQAGMGFVGPTPQNMRQLGPKEAAKQFAQQCGVPTLPALWSEILKNIPSQSWPSALANAGLKLPLLVKASNGGGGRGLRVVRSLEDLGALVERARSEAEAGFGDGLIFIEQYLENARHIEVQVVGDGCGHAVSVGDRECSVQRRYQKIIEEAPAPNLSSSLRQEIANCAVSLAKKSHYRGAGTVEFLLDSSQAFYFLEMNTRIQVEHSVTEKAWGVDLVQAQFDIAEGRWPSQVDQNVWVPLGHAIEARLVAENPQQDFAPTPGPLKRYREPSQAFVRVDSGVVEGSRVNPEFDSLVAKVIVSGINREEARKRLLQALESTVMHGFPTNLSFVISVLNHHDFMLGHVHTKWVEQNLDYLTRSLVPASLCNFFQSEGFCEQLTLALCGGLSCSGGPFAQKFSSISNCYLRIGSCLEEPPWCLNAVDVSLGRFCVSGGALVRAIQDATPELATLSEAFRQLHARSLQSRDADMLDFVATRVSQTQIAISCLGETLIVESTRHRAKATTLAAAPKTEIMAPLAGKITLVLVKPFDEVHAGQVLFVLESMKMQFDIKADHDAVIDCVVAIPGQVLTGPSVLATLKVPNDSVGG